MPMLRYAPAAARTLACLERGRRADPVKLSRVRRALDRLAADPCHPGLRTHRYHALPGHGRVFDSYVETGAGAWRIYWTWGPKGGGDRAHGREDVAVLTVLLIGPHQ
ncbi:hypothetical protein [Kitasatospora sp. NPDC094011]|uniref:hypothetical protein n=1 Tax=Kitasatospora sp. NPDC094011 TaxID=3364090 RepID=UPI0038172F7F